MRSGIATAPQKGKPLCRLLLQSTQRSQHSRQRISTQTHFILWKHPILAAGAMPLSPTPIGTDIQDPANGLPRTPLPRTRVNRLVYRCARVRCVACFEAIVARDACTEGEGVVDRRGHLIAVVRAFLIG